MKFDNVIEKLNGSMINDYVAVNSKKNPISLEFENIDKNKLVYVVTQYTLFPKSIVSFLLTARNVMKKNKWTNADVELTRNAGEELGTETWGQTHYNILIDGINETLGIDLANEVPIKSTNIFIRKMTEIMQANNVSYVAGATYALESSAIPELRIVLELTQIIAKHYTDSSNLSPKLEKFFGDHINNWEEEHETGLRNAYSEYIVSNNQFNDFEAGFRDVMNTMDVWWNGLHKECKKL